MATQVLIIGESGTGKSRSILNLNPAETVIINVIGKPLPFKGWKAKYIPMSEKGMKGNMVICDDADRIGASLNFISEKRPDIKTVIIDDFQYVLANEYMRRAQERGPGINAFDKFVDIGRHAWDLMYQPRFLRDDLIIIYLSHSEKTDTGMSKMKTIGKLLDEKICCEGMFTIVLNTKIDDGKYFFDTQNNGNNTTKSPHGMFESRLIDNDLAIVISKIQSYEKE